MANTPTPAKQGVRARERNALERISALEGDLMNMYQAISGAHQQLNGKVSGMAEVVDALVALLGREVVEKAVLDAREVRAKEQADAAKAALTTALEEKKLVSVEKIENINDTIITGVEYDKEGNPVSPGYVQIALSSVKPEYQEKLQGQGAGFKFDTDAGTFEVTGAYMPVPVEDPSINAAPQA